VQQAIDIPCRPAAQQQTRSVAAECIDVKTFKKLKKRQKT